MYARKHLITSAAAAAAVPTCQPTVHSNKVLNLEDNGATDEVFFKLVNSRTPVRHYALNQRRRNIGSGTFQGTIDLKVFERDGDRRRRHLPRAVERVLSA